MAERRKSRGAHSCQINSCQFKKVRLLHTSSLRWNWGIFTSEKQKWPDYLSVVFLGESLRFGVKWDNWISCFFWSCKAFLFIRGLTCSCMLIPHFQQRLKCCGHFTSMILIGYFRFPLLQQVNVQLWHCRHLNSYSFKQKSYKTRGSWLSVLVTSNYFI